MLYIVAKASMYFAANVVFFLFLLILLNQKALYKSL